MALLFSQLMAKLSLVSEQNTGLQWSITISDDWMQGRTTYGGLSAALCLQAVENSFPDLPPLRSTQVTFIGPAGGEVTIDIRVMRQGRSVTYIEATMNGEKGIATHIVFCFGAARESRLDHDFTQTPNVPSYQDASLFLDDASTPAFTSHFDCRLAKGGRPISGSSEFELFTWVKHKDQNANNMPALLGIADMPPPAVLPMFEEFAPISSMTWAINFLDTDISTENGWWLLRSVAEHAREGYSSQDMQVWSTAGNLVISARQNVAIFY